ncbi:MAG: hypothetical protein L6R39_005425 [Caloplaca ligustica]|nr:MAG: hypothetical protein L6R39_005425 [Caloplaca ligustica]
MKLPVLLHYHEVGKSAKGEANDPDDRFYQSKSSAPASSQTEQSLNKLFDKYRDNPKDEPDTIGVEGSMRYLTDLGLSLEEPVVLAVLTELEAPTMGELTRKGFVEGWKRLR